MNTQKKTCHILCFIYYSHNVKTHVLYGVNYCQNCLLYYCSKILSLLMTFLFSWSKTFEGAFLPVSYIYLKASISQHVRETCLDFYIESNWCVFRGQVFFETFIVSRYWSSWDFPILGLHKYIHIHIHIP